MKTTPNRVDSLKAFLTFGLLATLLLPAAAASSGNLDDLDGKIAQLSKTGTTFEDVVTLLGQPQEYVWGDKTFEKSNLPERFVVRYAKGLGVFISGGTVRELRAEGDGPGFTWQGKLRVGSSLQDVLQALGQPTKTVVAQPLEFAPNVLYKDIDGEAGRAYYSRPEKHVRCFLLKDKVTALYVSVDSAGSALRTMPKYDPDSDNPFQVDLRGRDLSKLDLRESLKDLLYATFDETTVWPAPERMPSGFEWKKIMELGKNPGLGVRRLHEKGITGRGVRIAIIDQPLLVNHQEYADRVRFYEDMNLQGRSDPAMHGAAVASIALGKTIGVAPEAELYYIAKQFVDEKSLQHLARCVDRIIEVNAQLPKENKIRVISISKGWMPAHDGYKEIMEAVRRAQAAGMLFLCTGGPYMSEEFDYAPLGRSPLADPEVFESYEPGLFLAKHFWSRSSSPSTNSFWVPMDSRTTASPGAIDQYVFYRVGGMSWAVPYVAGVYALAVQVDPAITPEKFWALAVRTGHTIELNREGKTKALGPIIDPVRLIRAIQAGETASLNRRRSSE